LTTVYLSLGSNLGDRALNLALARKHLEAEDVRILRASSIYETAPRDLTAQPWFLNQVIEAETSLFPRQLLHRVLKVERAMGRKRTAPKGPRVIDVDILLFGASTVSTPELDIPHPRMAERRFVLEPLAELAPDLRHPVMLKSVREMLAKVMDQAVRRHPAESRNG
jgi:2-amino-4-hydroxy-6-hydroxymethyldihydropteridine diphosphokinase